MQQYDAIIVGGGPAGSACAWRLGAAGKRVALLDKQDFPRNKVCAGWITPAILEQLAIDPDDYRSEGRVLQPIRAFRTGLIGGPARTTAYDTTVSYGIRRIEFDDFLLGRSGADLHLGERLKSFEYGDGGWRVNDTLTAPLLIGAGGHFCPVARRLGAQPGRDESPITAQEAEFLLEGDDLEQCRVEGDTPEIYFCEDLKGYGWAFRKGDYLNVGLGREGNHDLSRHVADFCRWLAEAGRIPADIPERFQGHAYLLYRQRRPRRLVDEGVMLIGDAAGLAYQQSGEGIRPAIESGLMAAETAIMAEGHYDPTALQLYESAILERFGEQRHASGADRFGPLRQWLGRHLMNSGWFTRRVVLDQWFLHRNQPPMEPLSPLQANPGH
jgi:geranylgeranyl reductase family protein